MTHAPPAYEVCQRDGCDKPVATADHREAARSMNRGGDEYCSLICRLEAEGQ